MDASLDWIDGILSVGQIAAKNLDQLQSVDALKLKNRAHKDLIGEPVLSVNKTCHTVTDVLNFGKQV